MQVNFGAGFAFAERIDTTGTGIGPRMFSILHDFNMDADFTTKPLRGQYQMSLAIARGEVKFAGKLSFPASQARLWSDIVFGVTPATGQLLAALDEAGTVPTTPFQITVTNAATFSDDLGVRYADGSGLFNRVTTPTAAGEYSVNLSTGIYTFGTADGGKAVLLCYLYNNTTTGLKSTLTNQLSGTTPYFKLTYANPVSPGPPGGGSQASPFGLRLNACSASKLSMPFKIDEFLVQQLDYEAFADASNIVGYMSSVL